LIADVNFYVLYGLSGLVFQVFTKIDRHSILAHLVLDDLSNPFGNSRREEALLYMVLVPNFHLRDNLQLENFITCSMSSLNPIFSIWSASSRIKHSK
jgi:hypothetical protein